ncbi:voltage-gated ion channel superfamily, putative [Bodo saltans]|uniref:Voltage-gated ion channel superfamily, putative n=1 Tax=Bodo saltans TaxID=75058 RepID=A0A0S4J888_BODSA|nr:voltage-gated ion channel superfamily, putative [Bodo saltans]|eukprot:CUG83153.1 voltage-gated ion channel superfamily, putative [Bodo saltans]
MLDRLRARLRVRRSVNAFATTSNDQWDRILRVKEIHLSLFSMIGLLASIILSTYKWENRCIPDSAGDCHPDVYVDDNDPNVISASANNTYQYMQNVFAMLVGFQIVISLSSLVVVVLLVQYYGLRMTERQREWSGVEEVDRIEASGAEKTKLEQFFRASYRFWDSSLRWGLLLEILLHCFYPVLWFDSLGSAGSTLEEVAESFVFVRLYLVIRVAYIHSDTYVFRADILKGNKELQKLGYRVNPLTTFKIVFYRHPGKMIISITLGILLVFSFSIFVVERNNNQNLSNVPNCFWFVFESLATIGYGDYTAVSPTGRIVVIVMATVMQFVMVLFGGVVTNLLSPSRELKYVQRYLEQRAADKAYLQAAVALIETAFLERKKMKLMPQHLRNNQSSKRSPAMYSAMRRLRAGRQAIRQSLGAAGDSVMDEKLREIIVLTNDVNKCLHEQGLAALFLQQRVVRSAAVLKQRLSLGTMSTSKAQTIKLDAVEKDPVTKKYPYGHYVSVH